jgi:hypothetical protein
MDKYWYEGIGKEEALEVLKKCMNEAKHRGCPLRPCTMIFAQDKFTFLLSRPLPGLAYQFNFNVVCIDKNGVTPVDIVA